MKIKYIFSMVAGLFVLVSTSCSEKKDAANATQEGKPSEAKAGPPATPVTPDKGSTISPVEAPGAYYVMLSGNG